jgi:hypothetical protein
VEAGVTWTLFKDMHSGGSSVLEWDWIYIELPEAEACELFQDMFGESPRMIGCDCCGDCYSIDEQPTLEQASGYERACRFASRASPGLGVSGRYFEAWEEIPVGWVVSSYREPYVPLGLYVLHSDVKIVSEADIRTFREKDVLSPQVPRLEVPVT